MEEAVKVEIAYGDVKAQFTGKPEEVAELVNRFLAQNLPTYALAKKLYLNYDLKDLTEMFSDYIRITPEGPRVITEKKLSDKLVIALQLTANRIAYETGSSSADHMTVQELEFATSINPKSISSRLSELVKAGHVKRITGKTGTSYKITTLGIKWLYETLKTRGR